MTDRECFHLDFGAGDPACEAIGLGAAALQYASMGYAVLPLARGEKRPHRMLGESGGVWWATTDPQQIISWWTADKAANVGVATGSRSGLVVIDLDVKHGAAGPDSLTQFMVQWNLELPDMPQVRTPSGGVHLWMRTPPGHAVADRPGILPGVDVKGDGGLVVAPPSMKLEMPLARPGERGGERVPIPYELGHGCPCSAPMAPAWLGQWLAWAGPAAAGSGDGGELPEVTELERTGVQRGQRNAVLYRLACRELRKRGASVGAAREVRELIERVWRAGDTDGMSPRELDTIMASAQRFVTGQVEQEAGRVAAWLARMSR